MRTGLALGAGAARGLAHIGVIEVLQEKNIRIDLIAGSSIGALIGAYFAVHADISGLRQAAMSLTRKDLLGLIDFAPGRYALIKGEKLQRFIDRLLEGRGFKDTKMPIKIVAADLAQGKVVVLDKGRLSDAVRASISIPGLFLPVEKDGMTLVDGGLLDSTPVDVCREMGAERVIAVDLPFKKLRKKPTLVEALLQSYEIMRKATVSDGKDTIVIRPDFSDEFTGIRFLNTGYIDLGRQATQNALKEIIPPQNPERQRNCNNKRKP